MVKIIEIGIGAKHFEAARLRNFLKTIWPSQERLYAKVGFDRTYVLFMNLEHNITNLLVFLPSSIGGRDIETRELPESEVKDRIFEILSIAGHYPKVLGCKNNQVSNSQHGNRLLVKIIEIDIGAKHLKAARLRDTIWPCQERFYAKVVYDRTYVLFMNLEYVNTNFLVFLPSSIRGREVEARELPEKEIGNRIFEIMRVAGHDLKVSWCQGQSGFKQFT